MFDFADQGGSAAGPIRPIRGSIFAARSPVWVRAMHEIADQIDGMEPTGFNSAALSTAAEPVQKTLSLDMGSEMQSSRKRSERHRENDRSGEKIGAEAGAGACRLSPARETKPSLCASLILDLGLYLSSPSQNLNLRTFPIRPSGAENDLRTWPLRVQSSEHLRSRKGACRTPGGRLFGPIGRLFPPSGHGHFGVALTAAWPCVGQACMSNDRQAMDDGLPTK
jgi:hypothetical protein